MDIYDKDLYFVAVKLLIRDGEKLLITHDIFGHWDLPGGRIKKNEFKSDLSAVIKRKILEELGEDFVYDCGKPILFFRVEREEYGLDMKKVRIFAIGYDAKYKGGEIRLGKNHDKYEWVDINNFEPEGYFVDGWLTGLQEYLSINRESIS